MSSSAETAPARAFHDYLLAAAAAAPAGERIGPFAAMFDRDDANPYRNYAVPETTAVPTPGQVADLVAVFHAHGRRPRLEYVASVCPGVEPALLAAGFVEEGRLPLMAFEGAARTAGPPEGFRIELASLAAELWATAEAQNEAYGGGAASEADLRRLEATIAGGGAVACARDIATGQVVGGGLCTGPRDGVTELAAIGVRAPFRRLGLARALTERLAGEMIAGETPGVYLMAGGESERRVYERAGFRAVGEILHISQPV